MNENNDVGIKISTEALSAIKNLETLKNKVNELGMATKSVSIKFGADLSSIKSATFGLTETKKQSKDLNDQNIKTSKSFKNMFDLGKFYLLFNITKRIRDTMIGWLQSSIDFVETQNLFDVSMGQMQNRAYKFRDSLVNAFGLAREEIMKTQASFNNVLKALPGLTQETSYALSETLMKMSIDYSSLFNIQLPKAFEKFQSAVIGMVKPIRDKTGLDITEKTIGQVSENLGVEKSVRELNQVEKRLLRIISLQQQMSAVGAMGDFQKTIESSSNQLKVMQEQLKELGVWLGNVFIGTIGQILPYINGFIMAIIEIVKTIATLVGFTETRFENDPLQTEDMANGFDNVGSSIGGATKKAKELQKIVMGFDVLNIIPKQQEDTGGTGASSGISGIDPKILNALKEYDNLMGNVRMKAMDIKDDILKWLGFTWEMVNGVKTLTWNWNNMSDIAKQLSIVLGFIAGVKIIGALIKGFNSLKSLFVFLGGLKIVVWFKNLSTALIAMAKGSAAASSAVTLLISPLLKFLKVAGGIVLAIGGIVNIQKAWGDEMEDTTKNAVGLTKSVADAGIGVAQLAAGGALIGSAFGPVGTVIGGVTGSVIGLVQTIANYNALVEKIAKEKVFGQNTLGEEDLKLISDKIANSFNKITDNYNKYVENIKSSSDIINTATEDINSYANKIVIFGEKLTAEQSKKILDNVNTIINESNKIIEDGTAYSFELWSNNFKDITSVTNQEQKNIITSLSENGKYQKLEIQKAQNGITNVYDNAIKTRGYLTEEEYNYIQQQLKKIRELTESQMTTANANFLIVKQKFNDASFKLDEQSYTKAKEQIVKAKEEQEKIINDYNVQSVIDADKNYKITLERLKSQGMSETEAIKQATNEKQLALNAANETRKINEMKLADEIKQVNNELTKRIQSEYVQLLSEMGNSGNDVQKKQKELLEGIFKNLNIDPSEIISKSRNAGESAGSSYKYSFKDAAKINSSDLINTNMYNSGANAANSFSTGFKSRPFSMSFRLDSVSNAIKFFENGGFPSIGQMFVAREAGPELVGNIGGKTAVVNNDQIVQAVSQGVAQAVASVMGVNRSLSQPIQINIGSKTIFDDIVSTSKRDMNMNGVVRVGV